MVEGRILSEGFSNPGSEAAAGGGECTWAFGGVGACACVFEPLGEGARAFRVWAASATMRESGGGHVERYMYEAEKEGVEGVVKEGCVCAVQLVAYGGVVGTVKVASQAGGAQESVLQGGEFGELPKEPASGEGEAGIADGASPASLDDAGGTPGAVEEEGEVRRWRSSRR